ncbi:MAG: N-6 DNA methylase, partial [Oscillospiraceae bacterium]|nr:N-6 DNA methylase [Oscillospiraceae bacterium]
RENYIQNRRPSDKSSFGKGLHEPELFAMVRRMREGEDIRAELAKAVLMPEWSYQTKAGHAYDVKFGEDAVTAKMGDLQRTFRYDEVGGELLHILEQEHQKLNHESAVQWLVDDHPDYTWEQAEALVNAFDAAAADGWKESPEKREVIYQALLEIQKDEKLAAATLQSIAKCKYDVEIQLSDAPQKRDNEPLSLRQTGDFYEVRGKDVQNAAAVLGVPVENEVARIPVDDENSLHKLRDAGYLLLMEKVFALNPPKQEHIPEEIDDAQLTLFGDAEPLNQHTSTRFQDSQLALVVEQPGTEMLDNILRGGASDPHSLERIVAYFQKGKSVEDNAAFLREEFGQDGRGYIHDDLTEYAAWFDKDGITAALGTSAFPDQGQVHLTWEQAAERISAMLESGTFCDQVHIDHAEENELKDISDSLLFLDWDTQEEPILAEDWTEGVFPDAEEKVIAALKTPELLQETIDRMQGFVAKYRENPGIVPWYQKPEKLLQQLTDLQIERADFITQPDFAYKPLFFISDDQKDNLLRSHGGGKFRIAAFFKEQHTNPEIVAILKREYGEGGFCAGGYDEWHSAKGISLTFDGFGKDAKCSASMKWNEVAKRISRMIAENTYITQEDIDQRIRSAQYDLREHPDTPENAKIRERALAVLEEYRIPMGSVAPQPEHTTETAYMTTDGERFVELMRSDAGIDFAIFDAEMTMVDGGVWETENAPDFGFAAAQILGTAQENVVEVADYAALRALTVEDADLSGLEKLKAETLGITETQNEPENIYQLVTYDEDTGDDDKKDYPTLEEAVEDGRQYLAQGYDGFAVLNTAAHRVEHYEGDFPLTGIFSERVYKNTAEWHRAAPQVNESPIHAGLFGNGITYYDTSRTDPETNDFPTVAHVSPEGKMTIYDRAHLPDGDLMRIQQDARAQREKYERDWNSRSITGRFAEILERANTQQMIQIGHDPLSMEEKVAKYERSVIFEDEPFPLEFAANHKNPDSLAVGDRFRYQHREYTVTALEGIYPNDVTVSTTSKTSTGAAYTTTMNLDMDTLLREGEFLGEEVIDNNQTAKEASQTETPAPKHGRPTRAEQLYTQFCEQFPDMASGEHTYERYGTLDDASGWEPLSVEHLGDNVYSFTTFYIQIGNLMHDPDFTFRLDHENRRVEMLEYQQDGVPPVGTVYERVEDDHGNVDKSLRSALEENFLQNLKNAAVAERDLTMYDDKNGNRVELTPQAPMEPEEEPEQLAAEDKTPELRGILNDFSRKHDLGMLQVRSRGRDGWSIGEIMADGYEHPIGSLYVYEYGKPLSRDDLRNSLANLENEVKERGLSFEDIYSRQSALQRHGGISSLPKDQNLPEIFYADNPSERVRNNISAIRELLRLEKAQESGIELYDKRSNQYNCREASDARLRQYCGWGGLPQVFDEQNSQFAYAREQLQQLLTPEEYAAARASTLNAHYTPQPIIDAMYRAVQNMDLPRDSRILEPSCGTGNFIARMPSSIGQAGVIGVELDSITARLAKFLTQDKGNVQILHSGFEHADLQNNSFDLAIGNVPFGDYNLNDPDYVQDWRIHDAFFRRALDKVAPGGVVAFITSTGTLDKANPKVREYLAERANLIGVIRLPNTAFASAGTKASSDIIFLQKRQEPLQSHEAKPDWCYTVSNADGLKINSYFVENPQMILGKMEQTSHFNMLTCSPIPGADLNAQLDEAIGRLNAKITVHRRERAVRERQGQIEPWGRNFTYQLKDNKVFFRMGADMKEVKTTAKQYRQYEALCGLRDTTRRLLDLQKTSVSDEGLLQLRQELNARYDAYVQAYGTLNSKETRNLFSDDADFPIIASLESLNPETGAPEKADIFYRRTVNPNVEITAVQTVEEALQVSLDKRGRPDVPYMATLLGQEPDAVCRELLDKELTFIDPEQNLPDTPFSGVVERAEYLSGNVRRKLALAESTAQMQPAFQRNVEALKAVIPEDIRAEEIAVRMGCAWIDPEDYTAFLTHLSGRNRFDQRCKVTYSPITGEFDIVNAGSRKDLNQNEIATYGTNDYTMYELA